MPAAKYIEWEKLDKLEEIRQLVKEEPTDAGVARRMGITKAMLSRWRKTRPKIRQALVRLKTVDGKQVDAHDLHTGGPPPKLSNVSALQLKIDEWIKRCKDTKTPLTKTGLCLTLNISKDTLNKYLHDVTGGRTVYQRSELDGELHPISVADVLKKAVMAIEENLEIGMITGKMNVTGCIFDLKNNHGYVDRKEVTSISAPRKAESEADIDKRIKELMDKAGHVVPFSKTG